jgi:hypothetical protein
MFRSSFCFSGGEVSGNWVTGSRTKELCFLKLDSAETFEG